jgi:Zn-dependent protease
MDISPDQVRTAIIYLIAFIISVSVHEFGHAWMANRLGDTLPRSQGRLTLWPPAHIDPLGTLVMPLMGALGPAGIPLLAWGKPVQTNPTRYSAFGKVLVSVMGPAMNLLLAVLVSVAMIGAASMGILSRPVAEVVIRNLVIVNLSLMFFNLLPIPPLDGGAVFEYLLPERLQFITRFLQRYGILLLFALMMTGAMAFLMGPAYLVAGMWARALWGFVPE